MGHNRSNKSLLSLLLFTLSLVDSRLRLPRNAALKLFSGASCAGQTDYIPQLSEKRNSQWKLLRLNSHSKGTFTLGAMWRDASAIKYRHSLTGVSNIARMFTLVAILTRDIAVQNIRTGNATTGYRSLPCSKW